MTDESLNHDSSDNYAALEERIGYHFSDISLLQRALTRKAYSNEMRQQGIQCDDQEVFATLGDAALKCAIIEHFILSGCSSPDQVTQTKKELERKEHLAAIATKLGVGPVIILGKGEELQKAGEQPYVLAETLEALIGAIHLDMGYDQARACIDQWFEL